MAAQPFKIARVDFSGAVNVQVSDLLRKRNEAVRVENASINKYGSIGVSPGFAKIGNDVGTGKTYVWMHRELSTATVKLLAAANGVVKVYNSVTDAWDTLVSLANTTAPIGFATLGDKTVFGNGIDATHETRGTVGTTATITGAPLANTFLSWGQRVYALNTQATTNRNRTFFSAVGNLSSWTVGTDNFDVDSDSKLLSLAKGRNRLWNMSEFASFVYNTDSNLQVSAFGSVSRLASTFRGDLIFGFDRQGIWGTPEGTPVILSRKIDDYIRGVKETELADAAQGIYRDDLFTAVGDTLAFGDAPVLTNSVFVFDMAANALRVMTDWNAVSFAPWVDDKFYMVFGTADGKVMKYPSGTSYNNAPINFALETGWDFADRPDQLKNASTIKLLATRGAGTTAQYKLLTEKGETGWQSIGHCPEFVTRKELPQDKNWYAIKFLLTESTSKEGLLFHGYIIEGQTTGDR